VHCAAGHPAASCPSLLLQVVCSLWQLQPTHSWRACLASPPQRGHARGPSHAPGPSHALGPSHARRWAAASAVASWHTRSARPSRQPSRCAARAARVGRAAGRYESCSRRQSPCRHARSNTEAWRQARSAAASITTVGGSARPAGQASGEAPAHAACVMLPCPLSPHDARPQFGEGNVPSEGRKSD
jgi:hypothetical protein